MKLSLNRSTYTYTSPPSTPCSRPVKSKARHVIWCTFNPHIIEIPPELISCLFWFGFFSNLDPSRTVHHVTTRVCGEEVGSRRTLSDKQCILILQWKADQHFFHLLLAAKQSVEGLFFQIYVLHPRAVFPSGLFVWFVSFSQVSALNWHHISLQQFHIRPVIMPSFLMWFF